MTFTIEFSLKNFTFKHTQLSLVSENFKWNFYSRCQMKISLTARSNSDRLKETNETESRKCFNRIVKRKLKWSERGNLLRISHFISFALSRDLIWLSFLVCFTVRRRVSCGNRFCFDWAFTTICVHRNKDSAF